MIDQHNKSLPLWLSHRFDQRNLNVKSYFTWVWGFETVDEDIEEIDSLLSFYAKLNGCFVYNLGFLSFLVAIVWNIRVSAYERFYCYCIFKEGIFIFNVWVMRSPSQNKMGPSHQINSQIQPFVFGSSLSAFSNSIQNINFRVFNWESRLLCSRSFFCRNKDI